jgi:hypothetical protein
MSSGSHFLEGDAVEAEYLLVTLVFSNSGSDVKLSVMYLPDSLFSPQ